MSMFGTSLARLVLLPLLATLLGPLNVVAGPVVSIQPFASTVAVGSSLSLAVNISQVSDLYAFQFDISFDPSILSAQSITEGLLLPSAGSTFFVAGAIDDALGTVTMTLDSLLGPGPGVTGSGTLAILAFDALATGASSLSLSNIVLLDSTLSDIAFDTAGATVNVVSVAEPGSALLAAAALLALLVVRRSHST